MTTVQRIIISLYVGAILFTIDTLASLYFRLYVYTKALPSVEIIVFSNVVNFLLTAFVVYILLDRRALYSHTDDKGERRRAQD